VQTSHKSCGGSRAAQSNVAREGASAKRGTAKTNTDDADCGQITAAHNGAKQSKMEQNKKGVAMMKTTQEGVHQVATFCTHPRADRAWTLLL